MRLLCLILVAIGCGDDSAMPDAAPDGPHCPAPSTDAGGGTHKIFLEFEGTHLIRCACENAAAGKTALVAQDSDVPAFQPGNPNRQQMIDQIREGMAEVLAPYDVEVTTTRPTGETFNMIVFGGSCHALTGQDCGPNDAAGAGVAARTCGRPQENSVGLIFDGAGVNATALANAGMATMVLFAGLGPSINANDCSCFTGSTCMFSSTMLCSLGEAAAPNGIYGCVTTPVDERAGFGSAFGCR